MNVSENNTPDDLYRESEENLVDAKATNNWRIFRIMAELVEGWQFLSNYNKKITIFGSARTKSSDRWYGEAVKLGRMLAEDGYDIVTGGGPGIMEAANRGAWNAKRGKNKKNTDIGESIGLDIQLPLEQRKNRYVMRGRGFNYFFVRKVMLSYHARGYVFFPGGYGTLDEVFELLTLMQTNKLNSVPIVLVGKAFWAPMIRWLKDQVYNEFKNIDRDDIDIFKVVDTAEEAYALIKKV